VTFSAGKIPLAPLANSFSPDYSGKAEGDLIASRANQRRGNYRNQSAKKT